FFQAEDGIRDGHVTGVQTCALPIWRHRDAPLPQPRRPSQHGPMVYFIDLSRPESFGDQASQSWGSIPGLLHFLEEHRYGIVRNRSEERRVGKECRDVWW